MLTINSIIKLFIEYLSKDYPFYYQNLTKLLEGREEYWNLYFKSIKGITSEAVSAFIKQR